MFSAAILSVCLWISGVVNTGVPSGVGPATPPSYVQTTGVDLGGLDATSGSVPTR